MCRNSAAVFRALPRTSICWIGGVKGSQLFRNSAFVFSRPPPAYGTRPFSVPWILKPSFSYMPFGKRLQLELSNVLIYFKIYLVFLQSTCHTYACSSTVPVFVKIVDRGGGKVTAPPGALLRCCVLFYDSAMLGCTRARGVVACALIATHDVCLLCSSTCVLVC